MSSLAASPGKENSMGSEKDLETKDLSQLLSDVKEVSFQINNPDALKADKTDAGDLFNVLGNHAAVVDKLTASLDSALRQIRENETDMKEGRKGAIDGLNTAKDLSNCVEMLLKATASLLTQLTEGSKVTACFDKLAAPLGQLIEVVNAKQYKSLGSIVLSTSVKLLKKMETSSSGPFESSLLSSSEVFLSRSLNHTSFDLRRAVVAMWKTTFADSKELVYSDKMRSVLLVAAKRHSMFLPGLSVETIDEPKTPTSKPPNTIKIRSSKKRVAALLDEDSVDYVPIQQTPASSKKMKLTEHQKEIFSTRMDNIPLMDEDSIQPGSIPNKLAEEFDVETSMSTSQSTKTPVEKSAVRRISPRLEEQKKTETTEVSPKEASPEEEPPVVAEEIEEPEEEGKKSPEVAVKKRKSPKENGSGGKKAALKKKKAQEEEAADPEVSRDGVVRRGARRSLKLCSTDENKTSEVEADEPSSVASSVSSIDVIESSSESSQDSSDVSSKRSRRSRAKGTPSKFVAKPRRSKASAGAVEAKAATPQKKKKKRGRPAKKVDPVVEAEEDSVAKKDEVGSPRKEAEETEEVAPVAEEVAAVAEEREKSPVRDIQEEKDQFSTPKKDEDNFNAPASALRVTPGILKKVGTPSTAERRHRVHFTNEAVMRKEERNGIVATPKRTPGALNADDQRMKEPVFPLLVDNKDPLAKVLSELCPFETSTALNFLRRAVEQNKILTIGDLARATGKDISALPIKNPRYETVQNRLREYAQSIGLISPEKKVEEKEEETDEDLEKEWKDVEVLFERVDSPTMQKQRSINKELAFPGPTPNPSPSDSPLVYDVEDTPEPEDLPPPSAPENNNFTRLLGDLQSLSSSAKGLDLTTDLTSDQAKQLLASSSETMSSLAAFQNKLISRIA